MPCRSGILHERRDWKVLQKEVLVVVREEEGVVGCGKWSSLPMEILVEVIRRVEERDKAWPKRKQVAYCAEVCRSWRAAVMEVVHTVERSGLITFPLSLKQPGPRDSPVQCFIKRERATSMYYLCLGLTPALLSDNGKFLLAARKIRRATSTDFVISLAPNDFSRASTMYVGKLSRSNFFGTKFTIYDGQPVQDVVVPSRNSTARRIHSKQVSPRVSASNYAVASISYEVNVLRSRGPRKMLCNMHSIPFSAIQEAPTPTNMPLNWKEKFFSMPSAMNKSAVSAFCSERAPLTPAGPSATSSLGPLVMKNKTPRWHEQLRCWCLNFQGRVTVASVKNFQLVADVQPHQQISALEQEKVILQFGKIGRDIFTMDYTYPISAFQAFAICLSSFDTKTICE